VLPPFAWGEEEEEDDDVTALLLLPLLVWILPSELLRCELPFEFRRPKSFLRPPPPLPPEAPVLFRALLIEGWLEDIDVGLPVVLYEVEEGVGNTDVTGAPIQIRTCQYPITA
jgi:hypothetical protein